MFLASLPAWWPLTIDDAFISARYARNLADGLGLVFNAGERVEGFSNPLLVLAMGAAAWLGLDPVTAAKALGAIAGVGILAVLARRSMQHGLSRPVAVFVLLLLSIEPSLALWSIAGLETSTYCLALLLGLLLLGFELEAARPSRHRLFASSALLAAAALLRPEGIAFFGLAFGFFLLRRPRDRESVLLPAALFAVVVGGYALFRFGYYGALVPNTYLVKAGGLHRLRDGLQYAWNGAGPLAIVTLVGGLSALRSARAPWVVLLLGAAGLQAAFVLWAGGDWMPLGRFLLPALCLLALPAIAGLSAWYQRANVRVRWAFVGLAIVLVAAQIARATDGWQANHWRLAHGLDSRRFLGQWLRERVPPTFTIAYGDAGALPYHAGVRFIDVNGLVDGETARILHGAAAGTTSRIAASVLERNPDMVIVPMRFGGRPFGNYADFDAAELRERGYRFVAEMPAYPPGCVPSYPDGRSLLLYLRQDVRLGELEAAVQRIGGGLSCP